jgi:nucleotide-binding universal stress UspA family protein
MSGRRGPRVVVGVSESLAGLAALRVAAAEARRRSVELFAVRVSVPPRPAPGPIEPYWDVQAQDAMAIIDDAFARAMGGVPHDIAVRMVTTRGSSGPMLLDHADVEDDLLVVGASRRPWPLRIVSMSSPVRYCVARARCPVLVVPPPGMALDGRIRTLSRALRRDL